MVAALELFPVGRGDEGHGHAVPAAVPVSFGPREDEEVVGLLLARPRAVELGEGVVGHAASPPSPGVGDYGDVLLDVTVLIVEIEGKVCRAAKYAKLALRIFSQLFVK